jgi:hypothetical protein
MDTIWAKLTPYVFVANWFWQFEIFRSNHILHETANVHFHTQGRTKGRASRAAARGAKTSLE